MESLQNKWILKIAVFIFGVFVGLISMYQTAPLCIALKCKVAVDSTLHREMELVAQRVDIALHAELLKQGFKNVSLYPDGYAYENKIHGVYECSHYVKFSAQEGSGASMLNSITSQAKTIEQSYAGWSLAISKEPFSEVSDCAVKIELRYKVRIQDIWR